MTLLQGSPPSPLSIPAIRRATLDDFDPILVIETRSFLGDRLNRRSLRAWLQRPHGHCLLATLDGRIAGYILVIHRLHRPHARIYSLAVDPDFRGRGLARVLLQAAEELVNSRGARCIRFEVCCHNHQAIRCYEALGYGVFGHFSTYYDDDSGALGMRKQLPAATTTCAAR